MYALQILGSIAVVAAFAGCAFDDGSRRWAIVALIACVLGTAVEFVLGAWLLGLTAGALTLVAGRRLWRRLDRQRGNAQHPADLSSHDLRRRT